MTTPKSSGMVDVPVDALRAVLRSYFTIVKSEDEMDARDRLCELVSAQCLAEEIATQCVVHRDDRFAQKIMGILEKHGISFD